MVGLKPSDFYILFPILARNRSLFAMATDFLLPKEYDRQSVDVKIVSNRSSREFYFRKYRFLQTLKIELNNPIHSQLMISEYL
jgi:hypothetical protein